MSKSRDSLRYACNQPALTAFEPLENAILLYSLLITTVHVSYCILPFKYAMRVMLIVIFLGNIIRAKIRLRKAGMGGRKGRNKSFSSLGIGRSSRLHYPQLS